MVDSAVTLATTALAPATPAVSSIADDVALAAPALAPAALDVSTTAVGPTYNMVNRQTDRTVMLETSEYACLGAMIQSFSSEKLFDCLIACVTLDTCHCVNTNDGQCYIYGN